MLGWEIFIMPEGVHIALPIESDGMIDSKLVLVLRDSASLCLAVLEDCSLALAFEC